MTRYARILNRELDAYLAFWAIAREGTKPPAEPEPDPWRHLRECIAILRGEV